MRRFVFAVLCLFVSATTASAANVVDYFRSLHRHQPNALHYDLVSVGGHWKATSKYDDFVNISRLIVDTRHGYIMIDDEGTGGGNGVTEVALFRLSDRQPLLLVAQRGYSGLDPLDGGVHAYRIDHGRWHDVTRAVLPALTPATFAAPYASHRAARPDGRFWPIVVHLPRVGTAVNAYLVRFPLATCRKEDWFHVGAASAGKLCREIAAATQSHLVLAFHRSSGTFSIVDRSDARAPRLR
jgi:hypothetical protein